MASNTTRPMEGTQTPRLIVLTGRFVTGVNGALSGTQTCKGFTIGARSAAGRYPITFQVKLKELHLTKAAVQIAGTAAYAALKSTGECIIRDFNGAAGTATLQFLRSDTFADADVQDNAAVGIVIFGTRGAS